MSVICIQLRRFLVQTFFLGVLGATSALAQLSPGDLARSHEFLEGLSNCTECHELGEGVSAQKCLGCHVAVKERVDNAKGYHDVVVNVEGKVCYECHSDHAGRDFELIKWPSGVKDFNHTLSGYILEGRHGQLACRDCHHPNNIRESLQIHEPSIDLTKTFLGLGRQCLDCHKDEHRGQLDSDCLKCHTNSAWRPATGFEHSTAEFLLSGKHLTVQCQKCHPAIVDDVFDTSADTSYSRYTSLQFSTCSSCHQDKHLGKLGSTCSSCHKTSGWKDMKNKDFDHNKTSFLLTGLHLQVICDKCHGTASKLAKVAHELCADCHKDIHYGQFAQRADSGRCEGCHNENGFLPSTFTLEEHNRGRFQLVGAHQAQPCIACHRNVDDGKDTIYRLFSFEDNRCQSCHSDIHQSQFTQSAPIKACTGCHSVKTWSDLLFAHDTSTRYPLTGAHISVPCSGCHKTVSENDRSIVQYRPLTQDCEFCHGSESRSDVFSLEKL